MSINTTKYENAILYLCEQIGGYIQGKKKLAKLLYYIDFDRYEYKESMVTITGDRYKKWKMGSVPEKYMAIVDKMQKDEKLSRTQANIGLSRPAEVFIACKDPDMSVFDEDDLMILRRVVDKYGQLTGRELEILSHAEAPYISVDENEYIPFEYTFYRGTFDNEILSA